MSILKIDLAIALFFVFIAVSIAHNSPSDITGVWLTPEKDSKIQISKINNSYSGKVSWLLHPNDKNGNPLHDLHNPDKTKRSQPIIGLEILSVTKNAGNIYKGRIYDAETGKTYEVTAIVNGNTLEIRIQFMLIKYKETWVREP